MSKERIILNKTLGILSSFLLGSVSTFTCVNYETLTIPLVAFLAITFMLGVYGLLSSFE